MMSRLGGLAAGGQASKGARGLDALNGPGEADMFDAFEVNHHLTSASGSDSEESSVQYATSLHSDSLEGSPCVEAFPSTTSSASAIPNGRSWNEVLGMHPRSASSGSCSSSSNSGHGNGHTLSELDNMHFRPHDGIFPSDIPGKLMSLNAPYISRSTREPTNDNTGWGSAFDLPATPLPSAFNLDDGPAMHDVSGLGSHFSDPEPHRASHGGFFENQDTNHLLQHQHHHQNQNQQQHNHHAPHHTDSCCMHQPQAQPFLNNPMDAHRETCFSQVSVDPNNQLSSNKPPSMAATVEVYAVREDKRLMGFKSCYERRWNSRTRTKNLRCFPQCGPGAKHNAKGFCGCAIKGIVHMPCAPTTELFGWAVLDLKDSQKVTDFKQDGGIRIDHMRALERSKQNPRNEFLPCRVVHELANMVSLFANEDYMGWDYRWTGHKHTSHIQHCLFVLIFQRDPGNPDWLQLIGIGETTPFKLTSARTALPAKSAIAEAAAPAAAPAAAAEILPPLPPASSSASAPFTDHIKQERVASELSQHSATSSSSRTTSEDNEEKSPTASGKRKCPVVPALDAAGAASPRRVRLRAEARESLLRSILEYCKRERVDALEKRRNRRYMIQSEITSRITAPIFFDALKSQELSESLLDLDPNLDLNCFDDMDMLSSSSSEDDQSSPGPDDRDSGSGSPVEGRPHASSTSSLSSSDSAPGQERPRRRDRKVENIVLSTIARDQGLSQRLAEFFSESSVNHGDDAQTNADGDFGKGVKSGKQRQGTMKLFRNFEVIIRSCLEDVIDDARAGTTTFDEDDVHILEQFQRSLVSARNLARLDKRWYSIRVTHEFSLLSADWRMRKAPHHGYDDEFFQNLMCDKTGMFNKVVATALSSAFRQLAFKCHDNAVSIRIGNGAVPMNLQSMYLFKTDGEEHVFPFDGPVLWFGELPKKTYVCTIENNDQGTLMLLNCTVRDAEGYCVGLLESIFVAYDRPDELIYRRSMYEFSSKPELSRDVGSIWPVKYRDRFIGETVEVFDKRFSYAQPAVYELRVKAELENVAKVSFPEQWSLVVKAATSDETRSVIVDPTNEEEISGSRGTCNFKLKWPGEKKDSWLKVVEPKKGQVSFLTADTADDFVAVIAFECRGMEPVEWNHKDGAFTVEAVSGKVFDDVSFAEDDFYDYDEDADASIGVSEIAHTIERA
ncbi:UPF0587 protein C1orf123-like [Hondaea fermentalgiana]|uniref:UPF0587 protein C1orf123-like n=1 Tax=Hondaea fermentalgiana TaxID=2315210 RepID=A0A2R5GAA3_9STRA|nr:UPF0587 protein C1orf123-like [Hondaea fermentalgiana]|eukprot:GBG24634.1 UPF0587 protein C1orf123-like [Hondaea fermentalgiana]